MKQSRGLSRLEGTVEVGKAKLYSHVKNSLNYIVYKALNHSVAF